VIFGITIAGSVELGPDIDVTLNMNHYEAFTLLLIYTHGFGAAHKKRLSRTGFEDQISSYGIDPSDPGFKKAIRSARKKGSLNRGALPWNQLTYDGYMLGYALERNNESFPVSHPLPTIEALAATLRYAEQHTLYANSGICGGTAIDQAGKRLSEQFLEDHPELAANVVDGELTDEFKEEKIEMMLGYGILFMYEGHLYRIEPGSPSELDDEVNE
jgi:hypothetical protein